MLSHHFPTVNILGVQDDQRAGEWALYADHDGFYVQHISHRCDDRIYGAYDDFEEALRHADAANLMRDRLAGDS
jgi:hypothetical protein